MSDTDTTQGEPLVDRLNRLEAELEAARDRIDALRVDRITLTKEVETANHRVDTLLEVVKNLSQGRR